MLDKKLIKVSEAQKILGVSRHKMAKLLAEEVLPHVTDPHDKRLKLVKMDDVLRLHETKQLRGKAA